MNDDFDERVRALLAGEVGRAPAPPSVGSIDSAESPARRRERFGSVPGWGLALGSASVVVAMVVGLTAVIGDSDPIEIPTGVADDATSGEWERVADPPIPPRVHTTLAWTGEEVFVLGGDDWWCPPGASCSRPTTPPMTDAAAYNPKTDQWRVLPDLPVAFSHASTAVLLDAVYVSTWDSSGIPSGSPASLLRYDRDGNEWRTVEHPYGQLAAIAAWGPNRLVAEVSVDEGAVVPLRVFDETTQVWTELPDSPLTKGFDTVTVPFEGSLYQFDRPIDHAPDEPALVRVARYQSTTGWMQFDDLPMLSTGPWFRTGDNQLAVLDAGSEDGGATNNWGREVPYGGMFETRWNEWAGELPEGADVVLGGFTDWEAFYGPAGAAGARDRGGFVFDAARNRWIEAPALGHEAASVVAAGRDAFAFGGADPDTGALIDGAWIWRVRPVEPESQPPTESTAAASTRPPATEPPTTVSAAEPKALTQFGGCGDAFFWAATADDTVAITISVEARDRPRDAVFERTYDLATDTGITVEVIEGAALSPAFCNDVIDANRHRVDRTETIAEGIVTVRVDPPPDEFGAFVHGKATLEGARLADGRPIVPFTVTTDQIGFYAG